MLPTPAPAGPPPGNVLQIDVSIATYPITPEVVHAIMKGHGDVRRVVVMDPVGDNVRALCEFGAADAAPRAIAALQGKDIYDGCCRLNLSVSSERSLVVRANNQKTWDFTNPALPAVEPPTPAPTPAPAAPAAAPPAPAAPMGGYSGGGDRGGPPGYPGPSGAPAGAGGGAGGPGSAPYDPMSVGGGGGGMHGAPPAHPTHGGAPGHSAHGGAPGHSAHGGPAGHPSHGGPPGHPSPHGGRHGPGGGGGGSSEPYDPYAPSARAPSAGREQFDRRSVERGRSPARGPTTSGTHSEVPLGPGASPVVLIYSLPEHLRDCDRIFNLFSLYGNIMRIKLLKKSAGALVAFEDGIQAEGAIVCLNGLRMFGGVVEVDFSKHQFIPAPYTPEDAASTRDYASSPNNKFRRQEHWQHIHPPMATLHFSNGAPTLSTPGLSSHIAAHGAMQPRRIRFFEPRGSSRGDRKSGLAEFSDPSACAEAIALVNNVVVEGFTLRLAFSINSV